MHSRVQREQEEMDTLCSGWRGSSGAKMSSHFDGLSHRAQVCYRFKKLLMVTKLRLLNKVDLVGALRLVFLMKLDGCWWWTWAPNLTMLVWFLPAPIRRIGNNVNQGTKKLKPKSSRANLSDQTRHITSSKNQKENLSQKLQMRHSFLLLIGYGPCDFSHNFVRKRKSFFLQWPSLTGRERSRCILRQAKYYVIKLAN